MENLNQQFVEAGTLMMAGMVFVFAFLGVLIIFINTVLIRLAVKFPDPVAKPAPQRASNKKLEKNDGVSPKVVAAISSAVTRYRAQHKNK